MGMKKLISIGLAIVLTVSLLSVSIMNTNADTAISENPNPNAEITGVEAIRNSLNLVWNDEFGGDIGCGAEKQPLATTNGFDSEGNPTSDEVRANAKWSHERNTNGTPVTRNGQLQLYVGEDGRNSWTEDGVLHIRGQREKGEGYLDPITNKRYRWTADGLNSAYFKDGETHRQAFRFGMMEARVYTVNGAALKDENGDVVLDRDGNVQQDPATSQGLWNGFWTCGNANMSEETSALTFHENHFGWPYNGEIDICEAMNNHTDFRTYDYTNQCTLKDENGLIFGYNFSSGKYTYLIKHDSNGKTLVTTNDGTICVNYDSDNSTYIVADDYTGSFAVANDADGTPYIVFTREKTNSYTRYFDIKQETNSNGVLSNCVIERKVNNSTGAVSVNKTLVDTEGNCYGSANRSTAQYHHDQGTRIKADGTKETVAGATGTGKTTKLYSGFSANGNNDPGNVMTGDTGYHTYGIYWTPTQFVYYVDNTITGYFDISSPEYFALRECPQYAILTFPIGGDVPGAPNPALQYAEYLVDYVRIYQADDSAYGNTGDLDYKGSKGFPTLNELDKGYDAENNCIDMSYYQPIIDAYSHINIIEISKSNVELTASNSDLQTWGGAPLLTAQNVARIGSSNATITTKKKLSEGKYDIYLQGLSRNYGKNYKVTLNGSDIGAQLQMYSANKLYTDTEKYPNFTNKYYLFGSADAYLGTAEIVNGEHNLTMSLKQSYRPNDNPNTVVNGGVVRAIVAVKSNNSNITTVTIGEDSPLATTTTATTTTQSGDTSSSTTTTISDGSVDCYQITDVSTAANWREGWWNISSGALENYEGGNTRAALKKKVQVEYGTTYKLELKNNTIGIKYVLREYKQDGSFLKSFGTVESGGTYTPSSASVGFVSLTVYDNASAYSLIAAGTIVPSMTVYGSTTTTSSTTTTTTTTTTATVTDKKTVNVLKGGVWQDGDLVYTTGINYDSAVKEGNRVIYTDGTDRPETGNNGLMIPVDASKTYTIKVSGNSIPSDICVRLYQYKADKTPNMFRAGGSRNFSQTVAGQKTATLTTGSGESLNNYLHSNTAYIIVMLFKSNDGGATTANKGIKVSDMQSNINVQLTYEKEVDPLEVTSTMEAGAEIRLNSVNGIRFLTKFDAAQIQKLQSEGAQVELGTLIAPKDYLQNEDETYKDLTFDLGDGQYVDVKYKAKNDDGSFIWHKDVEGQIAGSLVTIKDENIARDFVGRAYVKVTKDENTTITYADYSNSDVANNTRSLAYVANALKGDTEKYGQLAETIKELVDKWADKLLQE